jgi:hypothetical protein
MINVYYFLVRKLALVSPARYRHVSHVVGVCPDIQMLRIYAKRIITFMQYMKSVFNFANIKLVSKTMCGNFFSGNSEDSVGIRVFHKWFFCGAVPHPASRYIVNRKFGLKSNPENRHVSRTCYVFDDSINVPMLPVPHVMHAAPTTASHRFGAALDRASFFSHVFMLEHWCLNVKENRSWAG